MENSFNYFKEKYNIRLNPQQEEAVKNLEGRFLLLAVPGSGKTTVLVNRLGYMINEKGIPPESVLAVTFNRMAAAEIKKRYRKQFGLAGTEGLSIQTINSLSLKIYTKFCKDTGHPYRETIDQEKKILISDAYRRFSDDKFPGENDLAEVENAFTYIKNMELQPEDAEELFKIENLKDMYRYYEKNLKAMGKMDFDDQMVFAKWILEHRKTELEYWRNKYRYICVDEAQDTSKIQHQIIRLLAEGNNLFMVGDEDQSIYGFRAAYPEALLNFTKDYPQGKVLKMETNYRSTDEIIQMASSFISRNKGRYPKKMKGARGKGEPVKYIETESRSQQFEFLEKAAEEAEGETAFLYRDNESSIVLADLLLRKNIPFSYSNSKMNFFSNKAVTDYMAYLRLILNRNDLEAFRQIGNKSSLGLNREKVNYIVSACSRTGRNLFDVLRETEDRTKGNIDTFITLIENLEKEKPAMALRKIRAVVYSSYLEKFHIDDPAFESLVILGEKEERIEDYLERLAYLKEYCAGRHSDSGEKKIILSTIHGSKGREFDTVCIYDVYDDKFSYGGKFLKGKEKEKVNMEERRLFYVGMTRAENHLNLIGIRNRKASYLDELFGKKRGNKYKGVKKAKGTAKGTGRTSSGIIPSQKVIGIFAGKPENGPVTDEEGWNWFKCRNCGKIKREDRMDNKENNMIWGICRNCRSRNKK